MKTKGLGLVAICTLAAASFAAPAPSEATTLTFDASLSGANENLPTGSPGIGFAIVTIDTVLQTMEVNVTFSGLLAGDTASHIHCCVAPGGNVGVATTTPTFTGFPTGVTAGTYDQVFDMTLASSYNPAFVTAEGALPNPKPPLFAAIIPADTYL